MTGIQTPSAHELLQSHWPLVQAVVRVACRRWRLGEAEREDFASYVSLKLLENDGARIRKFRGDSSFKTYLVVVVQRLLWDFLRRERGKWRASLAARSAGPDGVRLEELMSRDGVSFEEAFHRLRAEGISRSREELWKLAETFPVRTRPRLCDLESLSTPLVSLRPADGELLRAERSALQERLGESLRECLRSLPAQDALVLRMWFEEGMTAPVIARALRIRSREVYHIVSRNTARLRRLLRNQFDRSEVMELIDRRELDIDLFPSCEALSA